MDKINLLSINFRGELAKAVDLCFLCTPVVIVLPIIRQLSDPLDVARRTPKSCPEVDRATWSPPNGAEDQ